MLTASKKFIIILCVLILTTVLIPAALLAAGNYNIYCNVATGKSHYNPGEDVRISGSYFIDGTPAPGVTPVRIAILDPAQKTLKEDIINFSGTEGTFSYTYTIDAKAAGGEYLVRLYDSANLSSPVAFTNFTVVSSSGGNDDDGEVLPVKSSLESTGSYPDGELPDAPEQVTFYESKVLYFTTDTHDGTIYYSIKESLSGFSMPADPDQNATPYSKPISLSQPITGSRYYAIKTVVYKGDQPSRIRTFKYLLKSSSQDFTFYPGDGDDDVSIYVQPSVIFPRDMVNVSENTVSLQEVNGSRRTPVDIKATYDKKLRKVVLAPKKPLEPESEYMIILSENIRDSSGNTLGNDIESTFETAEEKIEINGSTLKSGETVFNTNKNPAEITVTSYNTKSVTINKEDADKRRDEYTCTVNLKPGANRINVDITYESDDTRIISFTINFYEYLVEETETVATLPNKKGKIKTFDGKVVLDVPDGTFLYDEDEPGIPIENQDIIFSISDENFWNRARNIIPQGLTVEIIPIEDDDDIDITNKGKGTITLPYSPDFSSSSGGIASVLYKPEQGGNYEVLGGVVNTGSKSITATFMGFGKYAVVTMVWDFSDYTSRDWAKLYVEHLWAKGIMRPLFESSSEFGLMNTNNPSRPEMPITRGEFTVMMAKALGLNIADREKYSVFHDLDGYDLQARDRRGNDIYIGSDYYYIVQAAKNGIISGSVDKSGRVVFNYFEYVTREQVATILSKALGLKIETNYEKMIEATRKLFPVDGTDIATWAQPYVYAAVKGGYFRGTADGTFSPAQYMTRPQAARLVYTIMQKKKLI